MLRTAFHVGYTGHRPLRKITIEQICISKRCSNHSITRIKQWKKRDKEQIPKRKKKIGEKVSDILFRYNKMENYNEQHKKMKKRIEIECLRTVFHFGYTGHRPLRKITIEH